MTRIFPILLFIGLAWGKNPCKEGLYVFLKNKNEESLTLKDKSMLESLENDCIDYTLKQEKIAQEIGKKEEKETLEREKKTKKEEELNKIEKFCSSLNYKYSKNDFIISNFIKFDIKVIANYDIIKTELDKMLEDYKSKIDLDNYWKEKYSVKVNTGSKFYEDGYLTALLSMNNPSQADADYLKRSFTRSTYAYVVKERNRIIERGDILFTKEAKWNDIVSHVGGYSELSKLGISKDDQSKFDITFVLEKIELISSSSCLAHVKVNGSDDALKFHKILKNTYKNEGVYKFHYGKDYLTLYEGGDIYADFKFKEQQYFPKKATEIQIHMDNALLPSTENYRNTINLMFDDLIPEIPEVNYYAILSHPLYKFWKNDIKQVGLDLKLLSNSPIDFYNLENEIKNKIKDLKYQEKQFNVPIPSDDVLFKNFLEKEKKKKKRSFFKRKKDKNKLLNEIDYDFGID
jgi:hypothetical protein